ncbi:DUF805 domain-containing protein, partial [Asticcacaulis sp. YBE204]|uniref:DUF805 domain-containing protein n=1 Tax=Asticcacaulis sp. YBE204 TaxID=1282363 RepID=UPI0003C4124D
MNQKIDWSELFFSSTGRVRQLPFLIAMAVLLIAFFIYDSAITGAPRVLTGWIVYPVLLFCAACVLSKRLHDRGRSGWWSAVILLGFMMAWPRPEGLFDFVGVLVLGWAIIDLALMP